MSITIPREAVEAAARATCNDLGGSGAWDVMPGTVQHNYREAAAAALNAAAPHLIAVARAQIVNEIKTFLAQADEKPTGSDVLSHVTRQETLVAIQAAREVSK